MTPLLFVLTRSESFSDLWPRFGSLARVHVSDAASVASVPELAGACGVLLAAGGEEDRVQSDLEELGARQATPVAVVGASTDYRIAISLLRAGAANYFALPADLGSLRSWVAERAEQAMAQARTQALVRELSGRFDFSRMIGQSPCLRHALERASRVIPRSAATVLITGETGTGKEQLARAIHFNGDRADKPFVEINCTALPENLLEAELFGYEAGAFTDARAPKPGLFEVAEGGTLFLDEIGDLPLGLQGKLLRVLEDKRVRRLGSVRTSTVDVRIIAATQVDLPTAVQEGRFRQDLFYRLNVVPIRLPPLRDRGDDVLLLARHFLEHFSDVYGIGGLSLPLEIQRLLLTYTWPGNIRELRNVIERAVLLGDGSVRIQDLFPDGSTPNVAPFPMPFPAPMREIEQAAARATVDRCGGNKTQAAEVLGISRKYLYELLGKRNGQS